MRAPLRCQLCAIYSQRSSGYDAPCCTAVLENTVSMASVKPFMPSMQAIKMSDTPRFLGSVTTCSYEPDHFGPGDTSVPYISSRWHGSHTWPCHGHTGIETLCNNNNPISQGLRCQINFQNGVSK